jgi:DNA-binding response OmpR family regulator
MGNGCRILIVEDEALVADFIAEVLSEKGHDIVGIADNAADAYALAQTHNPDLVLMDIEIKGPKDGIQTAAELQVRGSLPIIFLTAYRDEETVSMVVDQSPAAYLVKPVTEAELTAAVAIALKNHSRQRVSPRPRLPYRYCEETGLIYEGEQLIALSRLERRLAALLFSHPGQLITQEAILRACWPDTQVSDSSIRNLIFKMRRKLPRIQIEAIKDLGYRLAPSEGTDRD